MAVKKPTVEAPDSPAISVRQRRISGGARNTARARMIQLKGQPVPMTVRTFNSEISGRIPEASDLGWIPVTPDEIKGGLPQGDLQEKDGMVVCGGGREFVFKMPEADYRQILLARELKEDRRMKSASKMRQQTAEFAAQHGQNSTADRVMGSGLEIQEFDGSTPDRVALDT